MQSPSQLQQPTRNSPGADRILNQFIECALLFDKLCFKVFLNLIEECYPHLYKRLQCDSEGRWVGFSPGLVGIEGKQYAHIVSAAHDQVMPEFKIQQNRLHDIRVRNLLRGPSPMFNQLMGHDDLSLQLIQKLKDIFPELIDVDFIQYKQNHNSQIAAQRAIVHRDSQPTPRSNSSSPSAR